MNILSYKRKALGWMAQDNWGGSSSNTGGSSTSSSGAGEGSTGGNNDGPGWGGGTPSFSLGNLFGPRPGSIYGGDPNAGGMSVPATNYSLGSPLGGDAPSPWGGGMGFLNNNLGIGTISKEGFAPTGGYQGSNLSGALSSEENANQAFVSDPMSAEARARGLFGWAQPNSWAYRAGIRDPGSYDSNQQHFFESESPASRAQRMQTVGEVGTGVGKVALGLGMPASLSAMLGGLGAYRSYQKDGDMGKAAGIGLSGLPGYFGAAGHALQGNYGNAVAAATSKYGASPATALGLGLGVDASTGKDVSRPAAGLAGYFAGNALGGPVGGVWGNQLGRMFAGIGRK